MMEFVNAAYKVKANFSKKKTEKDQPKAQKRNFSNLASNMRRYIWR